MALNSYWAVVLYPIVQELSKPSDVLSMPLCELMQLRVVPRRQPIAQITQSSDSNRQPTLQKVSSTLI